MALSQTTIDTVKATVPALQEYGEAITTRMYEVLFSKYPETEALFANADNQNVKLAQAVLAYAENIDNLDALGDAVEQMAQRHVASGVKAEHYDMVADALMTAMGDVLGDALTDDIKNAWVEAYTFLAGVLIARETELAA